MNFNTRFKVPKEALTIADLTVTEQEKDLIITLEGKSYTKNELSEIIQNKYNIDGNAAIDKMHNRAVLNKVDDEGIIKYTSATFYDRLAYFCQYESNVWKTVPEEIREAIDQWFIEGYTERAQPRLKEMLKGKRDLIENAFFYTLQETLDFIDQLDKNIYVVPCNCRAVALKCDKPQGTCLLFEHDLNSEWDRGHGTPLTKAEAKEIVRMADKNGLMHTTEMGHAICNCCGDCCYPIRASKIIGATGVWPKRRYDIIWDEDKCIHCGKCVKACNFNAFIKENKNVQFIENHCLGCTLCETHCPVNAITLKKLD